MSIFCFIFVPGNSPKQLKRYKIMKELNVRLSVNDLNQIEVALVLYKSHFEKMGFKASDLSRVSSLISFIEEVKSHNS